MQRNHSEKLCDEATSKDKGGEVWFKVPMAPKKTPEKKGKKVCIFALYCVLIYVFLVFINFIGQIDVMLIWGLWDRWNVKERFKDRKG